MSDRSDEATRSREPKSTDDLLAETEELLSGTGRGVGEENVRGGTEEGTDGTGEADVRGDHGIAGSGLDEWLSGSSFGSSPEPESAGPATDESTRSRTGSILGRLSPTRYVSRKLSPTRFFSPKAFFALVLVLGVGVLVGGSFLPLAGRFLGMFVAAFLVGLLTATRRYLEVAAAGTAVGAVAALFNYAVFTLVGAGGTLIAVGTTAGAVACLLGYYFGRDLRDGLERDL